MTICDVQPNKSCFFLQIEKLKPTYQDPLTLNFVWEVLLFVGYKWRGNRQQTNVILSLIEGSCYGWQQFSYLKNKPEKKVCVK